ncbi:PAQR family membrane homeostasis protein TrhA [Deminuibacter soli]|uniref:Hemolysin D n=1 Tax=Deminuibacter soli TaxID=2291815 RepID=A0A3E1NCU6_9BACT|nr:hemolysin III family protein [Deminuibacter soli]RFM25588.1 hemolysin D [Deminuibacter soli]
MENSATQGYLLKQEIVNSIIHGIGIVFGISCLPILISLAIKNNNMPGIIGASVYGFCFLMLFTFSTLYHGFQEINVKRILKIFDHISIYFLIAGTYTPFLLIYHNNSFGITLLWILWSLTALGLLFKIYCTGKFELVSTIIYLLMGWIMLAGGRTFFAHMPGQVLTFICVGAGLYTLGVFFYLWDKYMYTHAVWHGFVLGGAICHYVAVLLAM